MEKRGKALRQLFNLIFVSLSEPSMPLRFWLMLMANREKVGGGIPGRKREMGGEGGGGYIETEVYDPIVVIRAHILKFVGFYLQPGRLWY